MIHRLELWEDMEFVENQSVPCIVGGGGRASTH